MQCVREYFNARIISHEDRAGIYRRISRDPRLFLLDGIVTFRYFFFLFFIVNRLECTIETRANSVPPASGSV